MIGRKTIVKSEKPDEADGVRQKDTNEHNASNASSSERKQKRKLIIESSPCESKQSRASSDVVERLQNEERLLPPRSRFRLHTIEGILPKGVYTIHVKPSSKAHSCQQYLIHQNFEGSLNLNQDYLFPYAEKLSLRLDRMIGDQVEHLHAMGTSIDGLTSEKIILNSEREKKAKGSVQFEDGNGDVITIGLQWWLFNESEYTLIEAYVDSIDDKLKRES